MASLGFALDGLLSFLRHKITCRFMMQRLAQAWILLCGYRAAAKLKQLAPKRGSQSPGMVEHLARVSSGTRMGI